MAKADTAHYHGGQRRSTWLIGVLLAIPYIAFLLVARTEGMRTLLEERLAQGIGQPVSIAQCEATPLLGLRLHNFHTEGVNISEVQLGMDYFFFLRFGRSAPFIRQLRIKEGTLSLRRGPEGRWRPVLLHPAADYVAEALGISPIDQEHKTEIPAFSKWILNSWTRVRCEKMQVSWTDERSGDTAQMEGLELAYRANALQDRTGYQLRLSCQKARMRTAHILRQLHFEALRVEGYEPLIILNLEEQDSSFDPFETDAIRKDLHGFLVSLASEDA